MSYLQSFQLSMLTSILLNTTAHICTKLLITQPQMKFLLELFFSISGVSFFTILHMPLILYENYSVKRVALQSCKDVVLSRSINYLMYIRILSKLTVTCFAPAVHISGRFLCKWSWKGGRSNYLIAFWVVTHVLSAKLSLLFMTVNMLIWLPSY